MTTRLLPFLLCLLGVALPLAAQTPDPPRFLLASVVVEGAQHDAVREIVAGESLLQPGRDYSEQELREAVYRIKRLPFVLDAGFSLRNGGVDGGYQLVITVEETRLFFYTADIGGLYDGGDHVGPGEDRVDWGGASTVGVRWFAGSQGLVSGSVQGIDSIGATAAQIGYTRYNLFGRGGFASIALATDISDERARDAYQGSLSLGMPIVGNHSLRADLAWSRVSEDAFGRFRSESRDLDVDWIYDTTDDPLFPTSGTRWTGGAGYSESEREFGDSYGQFRDSLDTFDLGLSGRRHWALTPRQSVSTALSTAWAETSLLSESFEDSSATLTLGYALDLWGDEKTGRIGNFRWESSLAAVTSRFDGRAYREDAIDARLTTGVAFRNSWGLVRFNLSYIDNLQRDFALRSGAAGR